ncbi:MAG: aldehyde dehydrogenase family protein, partial [Candidatus Neomarinimicrobiota bacterium]
HLVAHKIVPALASRNAVVVKPASQTPRSALIWAQAFQETDLPAGALSVLPANPEAAAVLLDDPRVRGISFTGSAEVGWSLKARAPRKHVSLELGGNAGAIVHTDADLSSAATALAMGAFAFGGQSCISTQRVFVHRTVSEAFTEALKGAAEDLMVGNPLDEQTDLGPLITTGDVDRVEGWVDEAVSQGATVFGGHRREGNLYWPTILTDTTAEMKVRRQEVFGPVVTVSPYDEFEEALALVNDSDYGLQAGVFTRDINLVHQAYQGLDVGGVMINSAPSWRIDHMPYGGVKDSGEGREGVKYAMESMTEPKLLVVRLG